MNKDVDRLVEKLAEKVKQLPPDQRYLVGIAGIPGSGKTTLGRTVTAQLSVVLPPAHGAPSAAFVGMDGFHLTRAQLSAMPDPTEAHRRRGAAFTFDGPGFVSLVRRVKTAGVGGTDGDAATLPPILAPSFDHATKDPVADDVRIAAGSRVVIFEGNYLALADAPWREAGELMDEIWFVEVDEATARSRLAHRHLRAGIVTTLEEGLQRADDNDLPNGREILAGRWRVDEVIVSKQDEAWEED